KSFTFNVFAGPNHPPMGQNHVIGFPSPAYEDYPYVFQLSDFPFTDVDPHALLAVKITTLPASGALTLFNPLGGFVPVAVGQLVSAIDISAGYLRFQGTLNAYGSPYTSFTFQVK